MKSYFIYFEINGNLETDARLCLMLVCKITLSPIQMETSEFNVIQITYLHIYFTYFLKYTQIKYIQKSIYYYIRS